MGFNFWHITQKNIKPVKDGIGFINIDFYPRVTGGGAQFPRMFVDFARQKLNIIISRATNSAGLHFKTMLIRGTVATYYVRRKDIDHAIDEKGNRTLTLRRAYGHNAFNFTLIAKGERHSLADYKISPTRPKAGKKTDVKGAVKREGGLKPLQRAFLVKRAGGKYFPFYRYKDEKENSRIASYISPSIPQLMKNQGNVETATIEAQRTFEKRLEHEFKTQWKLD